MNDNIESKNLLANGRVLNSLDNYEGRYERNASHFFLLNVAPCRVSCLTHRMATLSSSIRIIGATVSHVRSTQ
jgi:hypothetical protein